MYHSTAAGAGDGKKAGEKEEVKKMTKKELILKELLGGAGSLDGYIKSSGSSGTLSCFWVSILPIIWPEVIGRFQA